MNIKQLVKLTALGALVASGSTFAADGALGTTSTAATTVRAEIPSMILITGLGGADDLLDMGTYVPGGGDIFAAESFCVYRNSAGLQYDITMTGDGGLTGTNEYRIENSAGGGSHRRGRSRAVFHIR